MKEQDKSDIEEMVRGLANLFDLKHRIEERLGKKCCTEDEDDEDCDTEGGCGDENCVCNCEHIKSLQKDYTAALEWAFGPSPDGYSQKKARKQWDKLHPGVKKPRVLLTERQIPMQMQTMCLMIDVYPMYLEHKKKCDG